MRILLVEDDAMIAAAICRGLRGESFTVDHAADGEAADAALATTPYDALLLDLDLGLPGRDGLDCLARWRRQGNAAPVLVITARDAVEDRVRGLDTGADDYLVKPFAFDELVARLRALLRRRAGRAAPLIEVGALRVDPATREVAVNGVAVALSAREFAVLHALLQEPGTPLSRLQLEDRLYGWGEEIGSNAVEVHIHSLRRKLGQGMIRNLRGVGWLVTGTP